MKAAVTGPGDCCDFDSDTLACAETEDHSRSVSPCCDMLEPDGGCFREDSSDNLSSSDKVDALQAEVRRLEHHMKELQLDVARKEELHEWSLCRIKSICHNDDDEAFYTGFPDYHSLIAFFEELLQCDAEVMHQW